MFTRDKKQYKIPDQLLFCQTKKKPFPQPTPLLTAPPAASPYSPSPPPPQHLLPTHLT